MVDAFISTTTQSNLVAAAVDRYVRSALRNLPQYRQVVDTRPVQVDKPGSSVSLYVRSDLAAATTPLNELTDPDAVALPNPTSVTLTLNEYGNATIASIRAKKMAFSDIDPAQVDAIAYNQNDTMDQLVQTELRNGTNVIYGGNAVSTVTVDAADTLSAANVRKIVAKLRAGASPGRVGELYWAGIHPEVSHDLRAETGAGGWQDLHKYAAPDVFWPGCVGVFEGAFFVETARAYNALDGAASARNYRSLFAGKEAIAEAVAIEPHTEIGVVPDKLNRFFPVGWYGLLGWKRFREASLYRIETGSSIAS